MSGRSSKPRSRQSGFTLLEMLIATAILGVAVVTLLGLHARNLQLVAESLDITRAGFLATQIMESARSGSLPELGKTDGRFTSKRNRADEAVFFGGEGSEAFVWERQVLPSDLSIDDVRYVSVRVRRDRNKNTIAELWAAVRRDRTESAP